MSALYVSSSNPSLIVEIVIEESSIGGLAHDLRALRTLFINESKMAYKRYIYQYLGGKLHYVVFVNFPVEQF